MQQFDWSGRREEGPHIICGTVGHPAGAAGGSLWDTLKGLKEQNPYPVPFYYNPNLPYYQWEATHKRRGAGVWNDILKTHGMVSPGPISWAPRGQFGVPRYGLGKAGARRKAKAKARGKALKRMRRNGCGFGNMQIVGIGRQ